MLNRLPHRRRIAAVGLAVTLGLSLAACGSSESDGSAATAEGGFPVSVDAVYGKVTVDAVPKRVVALTVQSADILVSLGIQPVAVATSEKEIADTFPYLKGTFTGELEPDLLQEYQANAEKIASYNPDLIVGSSYQITEKAYKQVSEIAPTHPGVRAGNVDWVDTAAALAEANRYRRAAGAGQDRAGLCGRTLEGSRPGGQDVSVCRS
ncbi:ABC transporter substrate-binding protein [Aeromicrobium sp. UC242_57]|uniref:ABC transporter substrate-binding protein n=1 Tax=Aeromicrobium sp. UC242_57 TaxID=3374624 RepID=UPI0037B4817E